MLVTGHTLPEMIETIFEGYGRATVELPRPAHSSWR